METSMDMHSANQKCWPTSEFCTNDFIRNSSCSEVIHATSIAKFLVMHNHTTQHRQVPYQYIGAGFQNLLMTLNQLHLLTSVVYANDRKQTCCFSSARPLSDTAPLQIHKNLIYVSTTIYITCTFRENIKSIQSNRIQIWRYNSCQ
jgi:hypothetical protein